MMVDLTPNPSPTWRGALESHFLFSFTGSEGMGTKITGLNIKG